MVCEVRCGKIFAKSIVIESGALHREASKRHP